MSQRLISRSSDLKRLRDEGYDVRIESNHLVLDGIPYVTSSREIKRGCLVSTLALAGDITIRPDTHVIYFAGEYPCHKDGLEIEQIRHQTSRLQLGSILMVDHTFSNKPADGYRDYYEKLTTYANIVSGPAEALDPTATAKIFPVIESQAEESVFMYIDTASSRAGINAVTGKLELGKIGIVGLGGTGSYVLDLVAKTPVKEIHLFDGDRFSQHNAFRSPGAAAVEDLKQEPKKASYFKTHYSRLRRNVFAHDYFIDESNIEQLRGMDFVFLCLDSGRAKKIIVECLEEYGIPFIDVGMGLYLSENGVGGILRVTSSTNEQREHVRHKHRISFSDNDVDNDYNQNIQIADLNALNAALAVIKWKKLFGFYLDLENEHHSTYTIDGNQLDNEDRP